MEMGMRLKSEVMERNKETPACQTAVAKDGPELARLLVHVRERARETEMERGREWESKWKRERENAGLDPSNSSCHRTFTFRMMI